MGQWKRGNRESNFGKNWGDLGSFGVCEKKIIAYLWFYEYTKPTSEAGHRDKWDCGECMKDKIHQNTRNCGGKYPNSLWAKNGFPVGPLKVFQCPKTFISKEAQALVRAYDASESLGVSYGVHMNEISAEYVDLAMTVEAERADIRKALGIVKESKRGHN